MNLHEVKKILDCDVHMPAGIGAGLAGGDRTKIHEIIERTSDRHSVTDKVTLWEFVDTSAPSYIKQTHEKTSPNLSDIG